MNLAPGRRPGIAPSPVRDRAGHGDRESYPLVPVSPAEVARLNVDDLSHHAVLDQLSKHQRYQEQARIAKLIEDGVVGKFVHVQAGYFRRGNWDQRIRIPDPHARPVPNWTGSNSWATPRGPSSRPRGFFRWRLYWDYAGGPATDLLVHAFTPVMRFLDLGFPQRVSGGGGLFQYGLEIPDQWNILADYPAGPSVVLMNSLSNYSGIETILRGTDGLVKMNDIEHFDRVDAAGKLERPASASSRPGRAPRDLSRGTKPTPTG